MGFFKRQFGAAYRNVDRVQISNGPPSPVSSQARWPISSRVSRRIVKVIIELPSMSKHQADHCLYTRLEY